MEGFAMGLSLGIAIGIAVGLGGGVSSGRDKLQKQLRKAMDDKRISIHDKNGEPLTIEALFEFIDKNYKKG